MFALVVIVALVGCTLAQNAVNNDHKNLDNNEINSSGNDMEQCQAVCVDIFFLLPDVSIYIDSTANFIIF